METDAMRRINKFGNRLFQFLISQVTSTHLTDSLCGTKVFKRDLIEKIFWWQETFNLKDPKFREKGLKKKNINNI